MHKFVTKSDLNSTLPIFRRLFPRTLNYYYAIKHYIEDKCEEMPIELYADRSENYRWILMLQRNKYIRTSIMLACVKDDGDDLWQQFDTFINAVLSDSKIDNLQSFMLLTIGETSSNRFTQLFEQLYGAYFRNECYPCEFFYMTNEQQQLAMSIDLHLPDGFEFCQLNDDDVSTIVDTIPDATADDRQQTLAKLRFPSVGIRDKSTGQLVAFELTHPRGELTHHYAVETYRGRGLGRAVELQLCRQLIAHSIEPCKSVNVDNRRGIESSTRSLVWSTVCNAGGDTPIIYMTRVFHKN